jgi:hypothetical protein
MNAFFSDLYHLVKTYWKPIVLIVLVVWAHSNYPDVKAGITDGWGNK